MIFKSPIIRGLSSNPGYSKFSKYIASKNCDNVRISLKFLNIKLHPGKCEQCTVVPNRDKNRKSEFNKVEL